jgi:hypothetical protein
MLFNAALFMRIIMLGLISNNWGFSFQFILNALYFEDSYLQNRPSLLYHLWYPKIIIVKMIVSHYFISFSHYGIKSIILSLIGRVI